MGNKETCGKCPTFIETINDGGICGDCQCRSYFKKDTPICAPRLREIKATERAEKAEAKAKELEGELEEEKSFAKQTGADNDSLRQIVQERNAKIKELERSTYCLYCGEYFPLDEGDIKDVVHLHILTCDKHPMRVVEADRKQLQSQNARLEDDLTHARLSLRDRNKKVASCLDCPLESVCEVDPTNGPCAAMLKGKS